MDDLILNIDMGESKKKNSLVIETYSGKIKKLKNKTFSGPLRRVSIKDLNGIGSEINNVISKFQYTEVSKGKYVFECNIFKVLYELQKGFNLYFYAKDKKMHMIEKILRSDKLNYQISGSDVKFFFKEDEEKFVMKKFSDNILSFNAESLIYFENKLLIINRSINDKLLKSVENKKLKEYSELDKELYLDKKEKHVVTLFKKIKPVMYIEYDDEKVTAELCFLYKGTERKSGDEEIVVNNKIYRVNIGIEKEYIKRLTENEEFGLLKSIKNTFVVKDKSKITNTIEMLINHGFRVFIGKDKKKRAIVGASNNFRIDHKNDWFLIEGDIVNQLDNKKIETLSEILKNQSSDYYEIDDKALFLPEKIDYIKRHFNNEEGLIKIADKDVGQVVEYTNINKVKTRRVLVRRLKYDDVELKIDKSITSKLRPYQKTGVKWLKYLYNHKVGGCLADDMGLGKTFQVIAFLSDKEIDINEKLCLIILPKTLLANWRNEIKKFNNSLNTVIYHGSERTKIDLDSQRGIILTTYGTILSDINRFQNVNIDTLVMDEVQSIKNYKSKTYRAISSINSQFTLALSGTPFENNISEVWAIMNIINPNVLGTNTEFVKQYNNVSEDKEKLDALRSRLKPYVLRRIKEEVLDDLPEKNEITLVCDMEKEQRYLYNALLKKIRDDFNKGPSRYVIKDYSQILKALLQLRQVCCHPKLLADNYNVNNCKVSGKFEVLKYKIEEIIYNHKKVVVFSQFTSMLEIIKEWLEEKNISYFYLDGQTKNRQDIVDDFEKSKDSVFLISLKAGGVGLNLVSAQYAIIYDPWWNPAVENQAADRIYRIGQKNKVVIYRLISKDTVEEKIEELKGSKSKIAESIFGGMNKVNNLNFEEVRNLLVGEVDNERR